jgi:hypothetical protein
MKIIKLYACSKLVEDGTKNFLGKKLQAKNLVNFEFLDFFVFDYNFLF